MRLRVCVRAIEDGLLYVMSAMKSGRSIGAMIIVRLIFFAFWFGILCITGMFVTGQLLGSSVDV